jgi:hypothetical protein
METVVSKVSRVGRTLIVFQDLFPARGWKPSLRLVVDSISQIVPRPIPRKGLETISIGASLGPSVGSKTYSPQGDGNIFAAVKQYQVLYTKCLDTVLIVRKEKIVINENNNRNVISLIAIALGVFLTIVGYKLPSGLEQSIVINVASSFIATGVFSFFIIDRLLSAQEKNNERLSNKREKELSDRNEQKIEVFLIDKKYLKKYKLPLELLRGEFSRAEVLARIGMLSRIEVGARFSLEYTGNSEFYSDINKITKNETNKLEIRCTREEIEQFKMHEKYEV